jgi:hypothetical protein
MSERLEVRAELLKLSRLLGVGEGELDYLEGIPSAELRQLRESATERLFDGGAKMLGRVGAASRLVPAGLTATIAQRAFGPLLCARSAGMVEASKAVDVARRLPADFLADVVIDLDPRRVVDIIAQVPAELVEPVARELGKRREHVTMGRFLAFVPDHLIATAMGALDDETMLHTAFVLEHKDRLDHAVGLLPPKRLPGILQSAAGLGLWPEVLDLLDQLTEERLGPIADLVANQDEELVADLVKAVSEQGIWDSLLPVVRQMSDAGRAQIVTVPVFHDPQILRDIVEAAASQGLWLDLVPLVNAVPDDVRRTVAGIAGDLDPKLLNNVLAEAVGAPQTFETFLGLVSEMPASGQAKVVGLIDAAKKPLAMALLASLTDPDEGSRLYTLLTPEFRDAVDRAAERLGLQKELAKAIGSEA